MVLTAGRDQAVVGQRRPAEARGAGWGGRNASEVPHDDSLIPWQDETLMVVCRSGSEAESH